MRHHLYPAFLFIMIAVACGDKQPAAPAAPPAAKVVVEPVTSAAAVYYDEFPATLAPLNQVDLRPQVSGFVTGIHFQDGARVKKGQLLYSIDAQLYNANLEQAQANLSAQEANLVKAEKDMARYRELEKNDAVAKQLVDNAEAALEVARKQVDAAKAGISASQTSVRYTRIYAPFDGLIGISLVKMGSPVTAGQTVLNSVSSDGEMAVDINVDQREIYRFTEMLQKKSQDSAFILAFGGQAYPQPGKLALLDRAVDPQTGTIKARLIFPNSQNLLRAGMNGTVRIRNEQDGNSIMIPHKAVTEQLGEYFVYVPGDSNKVSQTKVVLGNQIGKNVIIREGLSENDSIVTEGIQNLREGAVIERVTPTPAAALNKNN